MFHFVPLRGQVLGEELQVGNYLKRRGCECYAKMRSLTKREQGLSIECSGFGFVAKPS